MPITVLDVIVIVVVLISAILAMVRGFVREVLSVVSWVAAAAAAYFFYKPIVPLVQPYIASTTVATIASAAAIFFIALIIASYITMKISDFVIDSRIGAIDRALGFLYGAVRGVLLLVIALLFFNWLVPRPPPWVTSAQTKPMLDNIGQKLMAALPEDAEATILGKLRGHTEGAGEPAPATEPPAAGDDEGTGDAGAPAAGKPDAYGKTERQGIDQLIENDKGAGGATPPATDEPPPADDNAPTTTPNGEPLPAD
jgi:membrane protein required for colicin V production